LRLDKKKLNDLILNHQIDIKKFPIDQQVFMDKLLDISDNLYENDDEKENALFQLYKRRRAIKNWVFQIKSKDLDGFVGSWVDFELYNFIFRFWVSNKISEAIDMTLGDDDLELKQYHIKSQFDDFQLGDWVQVDGYIESDEYGFGVVLENPPKLDMTSISRY
jgi:hypothetical protein